MSDLKGQVGEVRMTIQVTRKDTGKVDEYQVVGNCSPSEFDALKADLENGAKDGCHA